MTTAKTTTNRQDIERYIRVDHAGERAAVVARGPARAGARHGGGCTAPGRRAGADGSHGL